MTRAVLGSRSVLAARLRATRTNAPTPEPTPDPFGVTFTIAPPSRSFVAGASTTATVTATRRGGYTDAVTGNVTGQPAGVTASVLTFAPGVSVQTLTLDADAGASAATATLTVTPVAAGVASDQCIAATLGLTLTAAPVPGLALSIAPTSGGLVQGGTLSLTVTITRSGGYTDAVVVSSAGTPSGVTASALTIASGSTTGILTLTAGDAATLGAVSLTIGGTGTGVSASATFGLTVTAASEAGTIDQLAFRNDDLTGATVAAYSLEFDPGTVTADMLANLSGSIAGTQVALWVEDRGYRHYPSHPTHVAEVWVEHAITPTTPNEIVPVTFRFDVTPIARRGARTSYTSIANDLALDFGASPANITAPGTLYYCRADDLVRRTGSGDAVWDTSRTGATITPDATSGTRVFCGLYAKADGTLVAVTHKVESGAIFDMAPDQASNLAYVPNIGAGEGLDEDRQVLAAFFVGLDAGSGAHTFGTTSLNRSGVHLTTSEHASPKLFPCYPLDLPIATGTRATVAARCSASFLPWRIEPASLTASLDTNAVALETQHQQNMHDVWQALGTYAHLSASAYTTYGPMTMGYEAHARYGPIRFLRHALAYWRPWNTYVATTYLDNTDPTDGHQLRVPGNEAGSDPTMNLWAAILMRHPEAEARLEDVIVWQELYGYQTYGGESLGSHDGRAPMHVHQGLAMLHKMGRQSTAGYTILNVHVDDQPWLSATATGTVGRAQRAAAFFKHFMQSLSDQPGLRRFNTGDYGGCGPFMQGRHTDEALIAKRVLGYSDPDLDAAITDAITYMFEATRNATNGLGTGLLLYYNTEPGHEAFNYSEDFSIPFAPPGARTVMSAADCHESPVLNGCHAATLAWLIATTSGATRTTWIARAKAIMDAILSEPRSFTGSRGKTVAEIGLHLGMLHYARRHLSLD